MNSSSFHINFRPILYIKPVFNPNTLIFTLNSNRRLDFNYFAQAPRWPICMFFQDIMKINVKEIKTRLTKLGFKYHYKEYSGCYDFKVHDPYSKI